MTNEKFRPQKIDEALARLGEEAVEMAIEAMEFSKLIYKAQRFGLNDTNPSTNIKNIDDIMARWEKLSNECQDYAGAMVDFLNILNDCLPGEGGKIDVSGKLH